MSDKAKYALCGVLAGAVNGFFGGGGGMIFVPLIIFLTKMETKCAFATCVAVILPISAVSACFYIYRCGIDLSLALPYIISGAIGGFVGGKIFRSVPELLLRRCFAVLIFYGGVRSLLW